MIFCSNVKEAIELSKQFNKKGYKTVALLEADSQEQREEAIERLESTDELKSLD